MMFLIYNLLFPLLFLLYVPFYLVHIFRRGGLTVDYWERFGIFTGEKKRQLRALKNPVWIHAVSVGETVAAVSLVKRMLERNPDEQIAFSCGTSTGFATAKKKMPAGVVVFYCPIDLWWAVWRTVCLVKPRMLAIFEVEIWPNLIRIPFWKGVKMVLINGRMSDHSSRGYAKWRCFFRPIFNSFSQICMQTEEDAARVARVIGQSERLHFCGTMKFDQIPDCLTTDKAAVLDECFGTEKRVVFIGGSTHAGEEELLAEAYKQLRKEFPELKLVLVPRHQERAGEVTAQLDKMGLTWKLANPTDSLPNKEGMADVFIVNTTGELMNYFDISDICYVGKSLAGQTGGHNIIEPAIFGKAVVYGHHMENFRQVAEIFRNEKSAIELASEAEMVPTLRKLLKDPEERMNLGRNARATVERHRGAIDATLDIMAK